MARIATSEVSLDASGTEQLSINVPDEAEDVIILVDDGTTGNTPAQYDLVEEISFSQLGDTMEYKSITGSTAKSHRESAFGGNWTITLTNSSAAAATYRIYVEAK